MTDENSADGSGSTEWALREELRACFVAFDEVRADDMVRTATRAGLRDLRRWNAPLAAAAAVVVIGGGAAAVAAHGLGSDAPAAGGGDPCTTASASPSAAGPPSSTAAAQPSSDGPCASPAPTRTTPAPQSTPSSGSATPSDVGSSGSAEPSAPYYPPPPRHKPDPTTTAMPQQVGLTALAPADGGPGSASVMAPIIPAGTRFVLTGFDLIAAHQTAQITFSATDTASGVTVTVAGGEPPTGPAETDFPARSYYSDNPLTIKMRCTDSATCGATLSLRGHFEKA